MSGSNINFFEANHFNFRSFSCKRSNLWQLTVSRKKRNNGSRRFALATLAGIVPASFLLAHLGLEMTDGEADRFMYSALALGLITAIPIALKLARDGWGRRSG